MLPTLPTPSATTEPASLALSMNESKKPLVSFDELVAIMPRISVGQVTAEH
jgi:hypothetical protein